MHETLRKLAVAMPDEGQKNDILKNDVEKNYMKHLEYERDVLLSTASFQITILIIFFWLLLSVKEKYGLYKDCLGL